MSLSLGSLVGEARELCQRLRTRDREASELLSHSRLVALRLSAMKEYEQLVAELNRITHTRSRDDLVRSIREETRQVTELERQNKELEVAVEDHRTTIALVMEKFRDQQNKMKVLNNLEQDARKLTNPTGPSAEAVMLLNKAEEMAMVMRAAVAQQEEQAFDTEQEAILSQLMEENTNLRQLLAISDQAADAERRAALEECLDRSVQTELGGDHDAPGTTDPVQSGANVKHGQVGGQKKPSKKKRKKKKPQKINGGIGGAGNKSAENASLKVHDEGDNIGDHREEDTPINDEDVGENTVIELTEGEQEQQGVQSHPEESCFKSPAMAEHDGIEDGQVEKCDKAVVSGGGDQDV